jgi:hypothetical protein
MNSIEVADRERGALQGLGESLNSRNDFHALQGSRVLALV